MTGDIAIRVENVSKDFVLPHEKVTSVKSAFTGVFKSGRRGREAQHALQDVSFEIKEGEFFGIVGRNGSGKSTMLKILANIYQPTSGKVYTHGKLVPFIELGVGFNPELTGRENVFLNGAMLGFSEKEVAAMYDDIVSFAELERFMDQKLKNYSSGMQVRLAFSMATRSEADILLIDEVLAVGDADFQRKCFEYFRKLKKNKKTVVFVSHDMEAVREYCDRALLIDDSRVVQMGKTSDIATAYSRLFTAAQSSEADNQSRWGDNLAKITKVEVAVSDEHIDITQTIKATAKAVDLLTGFRLRDSTDAAVTGTNNKLEGQKLPALEAGESVSITWRLPNILSDGKYVVDPSVLHADGVTVADWWDGARQFEVKKARHLPYVIDPNFEVTIRKVAPHDR